jgi:hypothetical protein
MLKGMTYRKKNRLLLITGALLLLLTYMLSIRKTIEISREVTELQSQFELSSEAPGKIAQLEKQLKEIDQTLGSGPKAGEVQQALLGFVTGYCQLENVTLREFPKAVYKEENDLVVETNMLTIEGDFIKLLKLVYLLEQEQKLGKISSVRFFLKKDTRTRTTALNACIYLQNIKKKGHE